MGLEIEAKMNVPDLESIRAKLESAGATAAGDVLEINTFFDTTASSLMNADKGLRLRVNKSVTDGSTNHIVTLKGPRQPGQLKTREETEFTVDDPAAATHVFEQLGFGKTVSFEKRRRSWHFLGCKVELDEIPYLGTYVEVEGPTPDRVMHAREALGLEDQPIVHTSYIALLMNYLGEHRIHEKDIRFAKSHAG